MPPISHPRWASSRPPTSSDPEDADVCPDGDLVPMYAIVWFGSVARVVAATIRHETFGTEVTLALLAALLLTVLLWAPLRWLLFPRLRQSHFTPAVDQKIAPVVELVPRDRANHTAARHLPNMSVDEVR